MPIIRSNLNTKMAYDGGEAHRQSRSAFHIELSPGDNEVTERELDILRNDESFTRHAERGFYAVPRVVPAEDPKPTPKAAAPAPKAKTPDPMDKFVADFLAMKPDEQEALYPTVTPEEKAAIDKARK